MEADIKQINIDKVLGVLPISTKRAIALFNAGLKFDNTPFTNIKEVGDAYIHALNGIRVRFIDNKKALEIADQLMGEAYTKWYNELGEV